MDKTRALRFLSINLQHAKAANFALAQYLIKHCIDICLINEPYFLQGTIPGFPNNFRIENDAVEPRSAIIITCNDIYYKKKHVTKDIVSIAIELTNKDELVLISAYSPPSEDLSDKLLRVETVINSNFGKSMLIYGDFNAKSSAWSPRRTDERGDTLLEFTARNECTIINDPNSLPTYSSTLGTSWIDLIITKNMDPNLITDWIVEDTHTLSDHNYISFKYVATYKLLHVNERWNKKTLIWSEFCQEMKEYTQKLVVPSDTTDIEKYVKEIELDIVDICNKHKAKKLRSKRNAIWWNDELSIMRKKVRALRRLFQGTTHDTNIRNARKIVYKRELAHFRKRIAICKRESFKEFMSKTIIRNSFGYHYEVAKDKLRKKINYGPIRKTDGTDTQNTEESIQEILKAHFPFDPAQTCATELTDNTISEEGITLDEIEHTIYEMQEDKAPGGDGLTLCIIKIMFESNKNWFGSVFNILFNQGIFPKSWKIAKVMLIPKEGKDPSTSAAYRPICLLPIWGKVLDKIVTKRLKYWLETNNLLSNEQYGFRNGRSTSHAIHSIMEFVDTQKLKGHITCLISLDVRNAFNSVRWKDIFELLDKFEVPPKTRRIIKSFLSERSIHWGNGEEQLPYNIGIPQGSSLGPILWLLIINEVLGDQTGFQNAKTQAFADDIIALIGTSASYHLTTVGENYLKYLEDWARKYQLQFNTDKSVGIMFHIKKRITHIPSIIFCGTRIPFKRTIPYLGVLLDEKRTWIPHLDRLKEKVRGFQNKLSRYTKATWGLNNEVLKHIYLRATERLILYAVEIWYRDVVRINTKLLQIQRIAVLPITKCYKTVATDALNVLAGTVPLDIKAKYESKLLNAYLKNTDLELNGETYLSNNIEKRHPNSNPPWRTTKVPWSIDNSLSSKLSIYTDGSKMLNKVGGAYVVYLDDKEIFNKQFRLNDETTVYLAELYAIKSAVDYFLNSSFQDGDLYSDSRSALMALASYDTDHWITDYIKNNVATSSKQLRFHWVKAHVGHPRNERADELAKGAIERSNIDSSFKLTRIQLKTCVKKQLLIEWQEDWDTTSNARDLHITLNKVSTNRCLGNFYINQVLTQHGAFREYQNRFFRKNPNCRCGQDRGTRDHYIFHCQRWREIREKFFPNNFLEASLLLLVCNKKSRTGIIEIMKTALQDELD